MAHPGERAAAALPDRSCSIYGFNTGAPLRAARTDAPPASHHPCVHAADATNYHLPPRYTPRAWRTNKFSIELWLQHALRDGYHPWAVPAATDADLVLLEANFSMACRAGKMFSGRFMWQKMNEALGVPPKRKGADGVPPPPPPPVHELLRGAERTPKAFVLTDNECQPPWTGSRRMKGLIGVTDHNPSNNDVLAPFVLAKPWWLVGGVKTPSDAPAPAIVPWNERKLLFFAGHVPKLYIRPTRYLIWRQVRRHPGVTAISATLNCTIGSFSVCPEAMRSNFSVERSRTYCQDFCASHIMDDFKTALHDAPGHIHRNVSTLRPPKPSATSKAGRCINGLSTLRRTCHSYRGVDWADELGDMARSAVNLPAPRYFGHAMGHKFCMAAPGDFVSTPKITEYVAMGAYGGCLPILVLAGRPSHTLPYTRWLDWCEIAYIVSDGTARRGMASVLAKLDLVTDEEAAQKRQALLAVRDAFVFRPPHLREADAAAGTRGRFRPGYEPSAVDFLLGELCEASRSARRNETLATQPLAGGSYARCML